MRAMGKGYKGLIALLIVAVVELGIVGCGGQSEGLSTKAPASTSSQEASTTVAKDVLAPATDSVADASAVVTERSLRLGTSPYVVAVPADYLETPMTEEDISQGHMGHYRVDACNLDFDVYQFSKEDEPEDLAEFAEKECSAHEGSDLTTDQLVNGIPVASFRSDEEVDGSARSVIIAILDNGDDYVELYFWLSGEPSEAQANAVISSLNQ